jgi:hypothetical protein
MDIFSDNSTESGTESGTEEKSGTDIVDKFKDLKDLLGVLGGNNKITIKEEADRIKDIIKKVF